MMTETVNNIIFLVGMAIITGFVGFMCLLIHLDAHEKSKKRHRALRKK